MNRKPLQYAPHYLDESYSDDVPTEVCSELEEMYAAPATSAPCQQRKVHKNIQQLFRQTATGSQFLNERRCFPSTTSRHHASASHHRVAETVRAPMTRHAQEIQYIMRNQQQRPKTVNTDRNLTSKVANGETKTRLGESPPAFHDSSTAYIGRTLPQTERMLKPSTLTKSPISAHLGAPEDVSRFEERRTSAAAKAIAKNFQVSLSSGHTDCQPSGSGGTLSPYASGANTTSGQGEVKRIESDGVGKSASQTEPSRLSNQCGGDGLDKTEPSSGETIDQAVGLERSKRMIVRLIDSAIEQLRTKESASKQSVMRCGDGVSVSTSTEEDGKRNVGRELKKDCIRKLEEELCRLKILEDFM